MQEGGYFCINRKIANHWLHPKNQNRKFSEFEAWLEIIRMSYFVCKRKEIQGRLVIIPRGYFDTTVTQLSEIFRWDRRTVEKFLRLLENQKMIKRFKLNPKSLKSCTLIKVSNYNRLQPPVFESCKSEYKEKCSLICKNKMPVSQKNFEDNDFYMRLSK